MTVTEAGQIEDTDLAALEAAWDDDRDMYRVLFTGKPTRVHGRIWYLSWRKPQLIWSRRRYPSVVAAREDCQDVIDGVQRRYAGGRPAVVTWVDRTGGA